MKASNLMNIFSALQDLGSIKNMPAKISWNVARNIKIVKEQIENHENLRLQKAKELGTLSEDGTQYNFTPEQQITFVAYMKELGELEIDIPLYKIKLKDIENLEIQGNILFVLEDYIVEGD